jgi:predicted metal-dependent hydrolase
MSITVRYGEDEVACNITRNAALLDRIRIHVQPNGEVEIEAPEDEPIARIRTAAQKRARWMHRHQSSAKAAKSCVVPREFVSGETHFYLGRRHKLNVIEDSKSPSSVKLLKGRIQVTLPVADPVAIKRRLRSWYAKKADEYLGRKLEEMAGRISWVSSTPKFKLVRMQTQWGSCSPEGSILLNPALIRVPRHCIEYVIAHELCHLKEHNHSKRFYQLLNRSVPNWPSTKAELDGLAELVLVADL